MSRLFRFGAKVFNINFWSFLLGICVGVTLCVVGFLSLAILGMLLAVYAPGRIAPPTVSKVTPSHDSYPPPRLPMIRRADYSWKVSSLDGRELDLAGFRGKVIFLNVWATWCPPCVNEMPSIERLYEQVKDEGIVFICASAEDRETVRRFVSEHGYKLPIYTFAGEPPEVFRAEAVPTTFIIAPDGTINHALNS